MQGPYHLVRIVLCASSVLFMFTFRTVALRLLDYGGTEVTSATLYLYWGHNLLNWGLNLVNCGHNLLNCGHNLVNWGHNLLTWGLNLVNSGHNLVKPIQTAVSAWLQLTGALSQQYYNNDNCFSSPVHVQLSVCPSVRPSVCPSISNYRSIPQTW